MRHVDALAGATFCRAAEPPHSDHPDNLQNPDAAAVGGL